MSWSDSRVSESSSTINTQAISLSPRPARRPLRHVASGRAIRSSTYWQLYAMKRNGPPSVQEAGPGFRLRAEGIEPSTYGLRVLGWAGAPYEAPWQNGPLLPRLAPKVWSDCGAAALTIR